MRRAYRLALLTAGVFFASVGIFSLAIGGYKEACTIEKRVPRAIVFEKDFSRQIEGYRTADMIGYACQRDIVIKDYGDVVEFDCWHNGTVREGAECRCQINVVSYPKERVRVC